MFVTSCTHLQRECDPARVQMFQTMRKSAHPHCCCSLCPYGGRRCGWVSGGLARSVATGHRHVVITPAFVRKVASLLAFRRPSLRNAVTATSRIQRLQQTSIFANVKSASPVSTRSGRLCQRNTSAKFALGIAARVALPFYLVSKTGARHLGRLFDRGAYRVWNAWARSRSWREVRRQVGYRVLEQCHRIHIEPLRKTEDHKERRRPATSLQEGRVRPIEVPSLSELLLTQLA